MTIRLLILGLFIVTPATFGLRYLSQTSVSDFEIHGNYRLAKNEIEQTFLRSVSGKRISLLQALQLSEREALAREPWLKSFDLDVSVLEARVIINLREREPWLVVQYPDSSWLVARDKTLLASLASIDSPELRYETSALPRATGVVLEPQEQKNVAPRGTARRLSHLLSLIEHFEAAGGFPFRVERFELLPSAGLKVEPVDSNTIGAVILNFSSFEEAKRQIERFNSVLEQLKANQVAAREVDLRYGRQVVVRR